MAYSRRDALKTFGAAGAAMALRIDTGAQGEPLAVGGALVDVRLASISPATLRLSILATHMPPPDLNLDGALVRFEERRAGSGIGTHAVGEFRVTVTAAPVTIRVADKSGRAVQEI